MVLKTHYLRKWQVVVRIPYINRLTNDIGCSYRDLSFSIWKDWREKLTRDIINRINLHNIINGNNIKQKLILMMPSHTPDILQDTLGTIDASHQLSVEGRSKISGGVWRPFLGMPLPRNRVLTHIINSNNIQNNWLKISLIEFNRININDVFSYAWHHAIHPRYNWC